ncbi:DUF6779 domain-containing protein [Mycolicibacterium moriokaense]|uniref:DUF6779 domain-containing protein n=1 Tax=Mycolicibacterium moriokaense TaxID=39691 RepID=A0A318HFL1_9MYCO|nr:DUF6779 domain-containing protein [Mycolicibacterium moriokaense]PXX07828.1 hypothetical protein C8E89_110214 [Mycolicibacterium moriokaense]
MADLSRGTRSRRGVRRPGWLLLTVLLVLAIGASSALVFTNKVELLKLAVILSLWAAVVAAFVSVLYRRQSDIDQAKARDLKLVYDLQLDREISARREYELAVETQLRRELSSELRAESADEVAGLRAELAALRANLEILFDADLSHRPALESDRARAYGDWPRTAESTGRVTASRIDTEDREDVDANTEESPIIDVPAEPHPPEPEWVQSYGGAHRRPSETEQEERRRRTEEAPRAWSPPPPQPQPQFAWQPPRQERPPAPPPEPPPPPPRPEPERVAQAPATDWQPAPAEGQWIPVGTPGSNWVAPAPSAEPTGENGSAAEYVGRRRAPDSATSSTAQPAPASSPAQPAPASTPAQPAMQSPAGPRGRHSAPPDAVDPGRPPAPPTLAAESGGPPPHPEPEETPAEPESRRHRSEEDTGGQSVADLLARLQATPTGGGRRRRREE